MIKTITEQQKAHQRKFIYKIREENARFCEENARPRLANTETYGCQQNENDTERIRGMLAECGFGFTDNPEEADVVIYNTCAVRENAEQKVFGKIGILKHIKETRRDMVIGLCGCMVQQEHISEKIRNVHKHIDLVFGTHALWRMPELLYQAMHQKKAVVDIEDCDGYIVEDMPIKRESNNKAWVSIMYGCNNFCTYCIVPYVRGRERSREPEDILKEIKGLVADGCTEISLLGQNVNSYGKDLEGKPDFAYLLEEVNKIDGIERIRFATSHPKDISDRLISVMAECKKVCPQLHLPFQSGSNKVLKDMNRCYTREKYLEIIKKLREKIPDIALTSDVIVGFPTETNEDFEDTVSLVKEVGFDGLFTFIYSKRDGTKAATMEPVLSDEEIKKNFDRLLEVQNESSKRSNEAFVGKTVEILVDGPSKNDPDTMSGRTVHNKVVNFKGPEDLTGKIINIKIVDAKTWSLDGELINN